MEKHVCEQIEITIQQKIIVDKCIAKEIKWLNKKGIKTIGSCCGHGEQKPNAIIQPSSFLAANKLGYEGYYDESVGNHVIYLKSNEEVTCEYCGGKNIEHMYTQDDKMAQYVCYDCQDMFLTLNFDD